MTENQIHLPPFMLWSLATELDRRRQNRHSQTGETWGKKQVLYFVQADAFVKIGLAVNIQRRMHQISVGCPFPITLIDLVEGDREFERRVHDEFKDQHVRGEWFRWQPLIEGVLLTSACKPQIKTNRYQAPYLQLGRRPEADPYIRYHRYATSQPALRTAESEQWTFT